MLRKVVVIRQIRSIDKLMATWSKSGRLIIAFNVGYGGQWRKIVSQVRRLEDEFGGVIDIVTVDLRKMKIVANMLDLSRHPAVYFIRDGRIVKVAIGLYKYERICEFAKDLSK